MFKGKNLLGIAAAAAVLLLSPVAQAQDQTINGKVGIGGAPVTGNAIYIWGSNTIPSRIQLQSDVPGNPLIVMRPQQGLGFQWSLLVDNADNNRFKFVQGFVGNPPAMSLSGPRLGIGTNPDNAILEVKSDTSAPRVQIETTNAALKPIIVLQPSSGVTGQWSVLVDSADDNKFKFVKAFTTGIPAMTLDGSKLGVGTSNPATTLDVGGSATVRGDMIANVVDIRGEGALDVAEGFKINHPDLTAVTPGCVVTIDETNPGQLKMASSPYDRKVAGIISGAGDLVPGVKLGRNEPEIGYHAVALSGRVYAFADATRNPIQVGDLLTTSNTPGHAMKANDHTKMQGAIIGKAMTPLKDGKGLVLVLVSLQ